MSRTVHKGRRKTKGNSAVNLSSDRLQLIATERQNWRKKELTKERRNKKQTRRERWKQVLGTPLVDLELIEFRVLNEGKFIHYPASINDIARVMHSLPIEMLDGIAAIELCLGTEYQEDALYVDNSIYKPDPFTRRCGYEILPGVFSGKIEGNYARSPATIRLFAYVYDPLLREREIWELCLRQKMLMQFVWQVARHHYSTTKVARETGEDCETYADRMQNELVSQFVIPYLEKTYPEALCALDAWMQHHLCLSTPLSQLAAKPNPIELLFTNKKALKMLTSEAATDEKRIENCMYFAWDLYNCQSYAAALEIVTLILSEHPNHVGALLLAAIIYLKQEKYETAQKLAERLISNSQTSAVQGWLLLATIYEIRQECKQLIDSATCFLESHWITLSEKCLILEKCARVRLKLGDLEGMEAELKQISQIAPELGKVFASQLQEEMRKAEISRSESRTE